MATSVKIITATMTNASITQEYFFMYAIRDVPFFGISIAVILILQPLPRPFQNLIAQRHQHNKTNANGK